MIIRNYRPLVPLILYLFFVAVPVKLEAQVRFTISGVVTDAQSGETLAGASVLVKETNRGTASNSYGFYSVSMIPGRYTLQVSYAGFETVNTEVNLNAAVRQNIELKPNAELSEVVVTGKASRDQLSSGQMGLEKLNMENVRNVPVLFGERDILKTIQLLPGIKAAGEGNSGFYVRGGSADHNLILLDEANVYNASHLLGFFSTFNSDAIRDVAVYKGGMPSQYGGRLASVVDIKMDEGSSKNYKAEGGIGLIASRLKVEGPLEKDKGSFMLSGRRTYADLFLKASSDTSLNQSSLYFYDFNAKANYRINKNNTVYLSGYFGRDVLGLNNTFSMDWGNSTATLRWNHIINSRLFSNTTLIYSDYNYEIQNLDDRNDFNVTSVIRDWNLKQDYQYFAVNGHTLRFGINAIHHNIQPGEINSSNTSTINSKTLEKRRGLELAAYISDEWILSNKLNIIYGLRLNTFKLLGPGSFSTYNEDGAVVSSETAGRAEVVKSYVNAEPRISASYRLGLNASVKASYTRNTQNMHLLSNSAATLPTDAWVMSSNNIKPQIADQAALGYYRNLKGDKFEFSAEVYFKNMKNQIDYKNAANLRANESIESELLFGKGRAYGLELFLKKRYGDFNGWLGYTLSRTERTFEGIDNGKYFPAKQDRTHDVSAVGLYKINKRWSLSATFVYNTGNAVTYPEGKYRIDGLTQFYYSERNGYRMPDYHRLDLGATLEGKPGRKYQSSWSFGLYNAYNRHNAYIVEFRDKTDDPSKTEAVQTALFGIIPSVSWNFKF